MGVRLISGIHGHRIHCTGLRWERVDTPPSKGRQIYNRALASLLRRGPSSTLEDFEWRSLGLESPHVDSFVRPRADEQTHFRPIPEDFRETRFLCSINAPTQVRIQALIDFWDHGHYIVRVEIGMWKKPFKGWTVSVEVWSESAKWTEKWRTASRRRRQTG